MPDTFFLDPGQSIRGSSGTWYKTIQLLGTGGNAVTFLSYATSGECKGLLFAVKVFRRLSREDRRESFLREIEFLKARTHPAIMRIYDDGVYQQGPRRNHPFVVAEYLPRTLAGVMREGATTVQKISFSVQILSALVYLASLQPQVVHRDIKPQNIFVKGGSCVLGDLGLLKLLDDNTELDREVFKLSTGPGMPFHYPTPDLVAYANGEADLTTKSDVFQLGLTLAHLFTGRNPVHHPRQHYAPVVLDPIGNIPGELSGGVFSLLRRMLTTDAATRPSAANLMDGWLGVFQNAVERSNRLEGREF